MTELTRENQLIDALDKVLPQTQCGLCDYAGCRPYAEAMARNQEQINRCPPGGVMTLNALGHLLNQNPNPFIPDMERKAKHPSRAVIRAEECIGCTKCIQACPVDAILGTGKKMHTVIAQDCTGCELCIEPCPVDCIDMVASPALPSQEQNTLSDHWRERYEFRQQRLKTPIKTSTPTHNTTLEDRRTDIKNAITRVQLKKLQHEC
jgi:electron transport complex protein RnfB